MNRQKTALNGYFEREEVCVSTKLSWKLMTLLDLMEMKRVKDRQLPTVMREYLGEERSNVHEMIYLALKLIRDIESGGQLALDNLLNCTEKKVEMENIIDEIEELMEIVENDEIVKGGSGIDAGKVEFELVERFRERGKNVISKDEQINLLEPILLEIAGEIESARKLVKERVDETLELIKKQTKNKLFHFDMSKIEERKDQLKAMKQFAKTKLPKRKNLQEIPSDDDLLPNP